MAICKHAQIIMANCDGGGIPSRKIRCLAGQSNDCLVNCGAKCALYESNVRSYQRIIPQNNGKTVPAPNTTSNNTSKYQHGKTMILPLGNAQQGASPDHVIRMQQAQQQSAEYRARMTSLPKGNCGRCGGGNSAAMR